MKIFLLAICTLFFSIDFSAQQPDPHFYLDSNFVGTNSPDYHYIRVIKDIYAKKKSHTVTEFYRTGEPYSIGTLTDNHTTKIGEFTYYYKNGHPKINMHYNGEPTGIYQEWYEDGRVKLEAMYLPETADSSIIDNLQIRNYWDKNNVHQVIDGNGFFAVDLGDVKLSGQLKNGLRDSIWNGHIKSLKATFKETYDQGKFISGVSTTYNDLQHTYNELSRKAAPAEGLPAFYKFMRKNLKVPRKAGPGRVIIKFDVDTDGKLTNFIPIRDNGAETRDEVIRVLKLAADWLPAQNRGIPISTKFSIPLTFQSGQMISRPQDPFQSLSRDFRHPYSGSNFRPSRIHSNR